MKVTIQCSLHYCRLLWTKRLRRHGNMSRNKLLKEYFHIDLKNTFIDRVLFPTSFNLIPIRSLSEQIHIISNERASNTGEANIWVWCGQYYYTLDDNLNINDIIVCTVRLNRLAMESLKWLARSQMGFSDHDQPNTIFWILFHIIMASNHIIYCNQCRWS